MGTVTLPTYEAQEIQKRAPWPRMDPSAAVAAGNAQMRFLDTLFSAGTGIAENIIANQRADQMSAFMRTYSETSAQNLRDTEQNPITTRSPEFADIPEAERGSPNLSAYTKKRNVWLAKLIDGIKDSKVKRAASSWAADRWVSEKDGLARWDFAKTKEMRIDNYIEDFSAAVENGDLGTAKDLTQAMLMTGGLTEKQADDYLDLAHKDVTKRNAYLQALGMGEEKGLEYLTERGNLRYQTYDGQIKDMPLADQEEMVARFRGLMKDTDEVKNAHYEELHIRADSIADCDAALRELTLDTDWKNTENRYKWEERLERLKDRMLNAEALKLKTTKDAVDMAQEEYALELEILLSKAKMRLKSPAVSEGLIQRAKDEGKISTKHAADMFGKIEGYRSIALEAGLKEIAERIPKDDAKRIAAEMELQRFAAEFPDATDEEYDELVENIIKGTTDRVLDNLWSGVLEVTEETLAADKRLRTAAEKMTEDISLGRYVNRTEAMKEDLAKYAAYMFRLVQERYHHIPWLTVSVDTNGTETGDWGAAVLLDGSQNKYKFKLEDNKLVLYGYLGTRGNRAEKNWYKIISSEEGEKRVTAEEQVGITARKEERAAEQEQLGAAAAEGMELYRETVPALRGAGKAPEIVFADWIKTTAGWYNKKTLSFATNPDLKKQLDALAREAGSR